ncbi:hypothetical protein [Microbispora sp. CA-102843]|uniref:hypothetical protein n=1 Tax=Microbispora sp. CA-102843 TaxID=3239952 RepID=UPI003D941AA5
MTLERVLRDLAAAARLGEPVVTMVDAGGRPLAVRTRSAVRTEAGFDLLLPAGVEAVAGPVCLTFHRHGPGMEWQENVVFVGTATGEGDRLCVRVERALNDWSLAGSRRERSGRSSDRAGCSGIACAPRPGAAAGRRGQPAPSSAAPTLDSVRGSAGA